MVMLYSESTCCPALNQYFGSRRIKDPHFSFQGGYKDLQAIEINKGTSMIRLDTAVSI